MFHIDVEKSCRMQCCLLPSADHIYIEESFVKRPDMRAEKIEGLIFALEDTIFLTP